jgi:hypothetical protein
MMLLLTRWHEPYPDCVDKLLGFREWLKLWKAFSDILSSSLQERSLSLEHLSTLIPSNLHSGGLTRDVVKLLS